MSKIKNLRDLMLQDAQVAELFAALAAIGTKARRVVQPSAMSFNDLLESLRADAVAIARDTATEVKEEVHETVDEVVKFFRQQGFNVEILNAPKPQAADDPEGFLAAVQRLLNAQSVADYISEPTDDDLNEIQTSQPSIDANDDMTPSEMWELIGLQDELLADYAAKVEQLEAKLAAQAKLSEGANARCTGLHEGIVSALELIDGLDILRAKEHLRFVLRQAGVSDCNIHHCTM